MSGKQEQTTGVYTQGDKRTTLGTKAGNQTKTGTKGSKTFEGLGMRTGVNA